MVHTADVTARGWATNWRRLGWRTPCLLLVSLLCGLATPSVHAQTRVLPFYSVPGQKQWVTFDWSYQPLGNSGKRKGQMRFAALGVSKQGDEEYQSVEMTRDTQEGDETRRRKMRIDVKLLTSDQAWMERQHVRKVTELSADGAAANVLEGASLQRFLGLGLKAEDTTLKVVNESEVVKTALGTFVCQHVRAVSQRDDKKLVYHGWLNPDFPFGLVKFEMHEQRGESALQRVFVANPKSRGEGIP